MDVVPSPNHQKGNMPVIQCQTITARPTERFDQLVLRVNEHLRTNRLGGQSSSMNRILNSVHIFRVEMTAKHFITVKAIL